MEKKTCFCFKFVSRACKHIKNFVFKFWQILGTIFDLVQISGADCACAAGFTTADFAIGKYCITENTCSTTACMRSLIITFAFRPR